MERFFPLRLLALSLLLAGCGRGTTSVPPAPSPAAGVDQPSGKTVAGWAVLEAPVSFAVLADTLADDPVLEALVAPFRDRMGDRVREAVRKTSLEG